MTDNRTGPFWADNPFWSSLLLRLSALSYRRGADLTEVSAIASTIESGDKEQWYRAFTAAAERLEAAASDRDRPTLARRDVLWRATMYHRYAGALLSPLDPRASDAVAARRRAFGEAAALHPPGIEPVEVPYCGNLLPGWLCAGDRRDVQQPAPLVIVVGGTDGSAEEMYFAVGSALTEQGYTVLTFDGPGQGEALRRGITAQPDFESVISAVIDHVAARPDIDETRIGLVGHSLGGLYALRAAAFEPRLRSTVISSAPEALHEIFTGPDVVSESEDPVLNFLQTMFLAVTGSGTVPQAVDRLTEFQLGELPSKIDGPLLALYGGDDGMVDVGVGERLIAEAASSDKRLVVYPSGAPGSYHCQQDSPAAAELEVSSWIHRTV